MKAPPKLSGGIPLLGHLLEMRRRPLELFQRVRDECGEIGEMRWALQPVVMLSGEEAHEAFFRAPDEQLDQAAAYPFMTPIFGKGVVFDGTPEQRKQAIRNQSLRDQMMRGHAEGIAAETERMLESWGQAGEVDLLEFFAELTIYTSSACLIGKPFREQLTPEFHRLFFDLELGTDAFAYVNPNLPLPSFRKRDRARQRLVELIDAIIRERESTPRDAQDLVDVLVTLREPDGSPRYTADQITGMFISMMFAGHHTTSGTSAWFLIEMLRHPHRAKQVVEELDTLYADGREVSHQALRDIPRLECALKESLRLHPPLVILMRKVLHDFHYKDWVVEAGKTVAVSPAISNRMPEHFPDPNHFDPGRYEPGRDEDKQSFAWIPFGGGRHRCVGAAFAMMQLKAIFSVLLRRYEFEMAQPADSYENDHAKMVVQLKQPCVVRYQRRKSVDRNVSESTQETKSMASEAASMGITVDEDLCQGHGVCVAEAPDLFGLEKRSDGSLKVKRLRSEITPELRNAADAAVRYCPTRALCWQEGETK